MKRVFKLPADRKNKLALKAESLFQAIDDASPAEVKTWIDNNINATNIGNLRKVLTLLILDMKSRGG